MGFGIWDYVGGFGFWFRILDWDSRLGFGFGIWVSGMGFGIEIWDLGLGLNAQG